MLRISLDDVKLVEVWEARARALQSMWRGRLNDIHTVPVRVIQTLPLRGQGEALGGVDAERQDTNVVGSSQGA